MNLGENSRQVPTTPSSPSLFNIRSVSSLWPVRGNHTQIRIVDVPLAQAKERNAAAGAPKKDEDIVPDEYLDPPSPNPDSQQQAAAVQISTGEHGGGRMVIFEDELPRDIIRIRSNTVYETMELGGTKINGSVFLVNYSGEVPATPVYVVNALVDAFIMEVMISDLYNVTRTSLVDTVLHPRQDHLNSRKNLREEERVEIEIELNVNEMCALGKITSILELFCKQNELWKLTTKHVTSAFFPVTSNEILTDSI
ncbi:hypothetical protein EDD22DRAFT_850552 [Suillus occidentalis]|nr:hypothetical protein EDD22DRAFT_850552 [Suillus occidentalis]